MRFPCGVWLGLASQGPRHVLVWLQGEREGDPGVEYKAYIHPILVGLSGHNNRVKRGTLEVKVRGPAGSAAGKVIQGHSSVSHVIKAAGAYEVHKPVGP